jgi:zinc protease
MKKEGIAFLAMLISMMAIGPLFAAEHDKTTDSPQRVGVKLPAYSDIRLPNGARLLLMERRDLPLIAFSARIRSGSVTDPIAKEGLTAVTAELLQKGAGKRNAEQFAETVDSVGGVITTTATREAIVINGNFLSRDSGLMIEVLSDMLERPAFAPAEIEKTTKLMSEEISAAKDADLRRLISTYFHAFLFESHPYGKPLRGTEATLPKITREDVQRFYDDNFGGDRLVLAVVGDFDRKALEQRLRSELGGWRKAAAPALAIPKPDPAHGRRVLLVDKPDATQTYFWIGNRGVARNDPDRVAVDLANTVFGGRFTSILSEALRVKSGLTYGASSMMSRESQPGAVAIATYTKTDTTEKAVDMAIDLLAKYRHDGMDPAALESVKAYILGQFPPQIETSAQLATRIADIAFYGLDRNDVDLYGERIMSARGPEVNRVIQRVYPDANDLVFVFIGKASAIRDVVKKYGPVTEMKITDPRFVP